MSKARELKTVMREYWDRWEWIGWNPSNPEIWEKQKKEYTELGKWLTLQQLLIEEKYKNE